ncbi:FAD-dependent oxidoreductase [Caulobacter sp. S45]|uniref:FAD-dependent oxidoreductase n=1 Tax=Caulobacter sp. S45 TaxID=1641861 RepID=UPI0015773F32|nr:GMC family oxidoreductase [Caulobacter sp. S45]
MISDLRTLGDGQALEADICIVGAGAAGISIAQALVGTHLDLLLLESGGLADEAQTQALYQGESIGYPVTLDEGRYRVFGGSTSRWTGRCAKLDAIDFADRPWVPYSGWPIALEDLEAWYELARPLCGFPEAWGTNAEAGRSAGALPLPLDPSKVEPFTWRYAPQGNRVYINWGKRHHSALEQAGNVKVLLGANVTSLAFDEGGEHLRELVVRSTTGATRVVRAKAFVLCCGGIENARLLLANGGDRLEGGRRALGRFLMQHPRGQTASIAASTANSEKLQDSLNIFATFGGVQYEFGMALPAPVQRAEGLLNASMIVTYEAEPASAWESVKAFGSHVRARELGAAGSSLLAAAVDPAAIGRNLWRRGVQHRHAMLKTRSIGLLVDLEQTPDPASRVTLSDQTDRFGMPQARVDWRISKDERRTAARFCELVAGEMGRLDLGQVTPEPWLSEEGALGPRDLEGTYHHIATTRMSATPETGVVDADCRVHGVDNLFMAGCSVFSTGGHANPTFTIVALALRLADHLKRSIN